MQFQMVKVCLLVSAIAVSPVAFSQDFPVKPIRLIVTFPPGGTADIIARTVSNEMSKQLGVSVVVENKAGGAGGAVGTMDIARAAPDGYTIGIATVGTLGTAPAVNTNLQYDPLTDFSYISNIATMPMLLALGPSTGVKSFAEFVDKVRANPGKITFSSGGLGGVAHLMGERFQISTKTKMMHIPYRGANPALSDAASGQVDSVFDALASSAPFLQGNRLSALAVSGNKRLSSYPDVPTFSELGYPEVSTQAWYGLIGPKGIPEPILEKLYQSASQAVHNNEVKTRLSQVNAEAIGSSPEEYRKQVSEELKQWKEIANSQNIKLN